MPTEGPNIGVSKTRFIQIDGFEQFDAERVHRRVQNLQNEHYEVHALLGKAGHVSPPFFLGVLRFEAAYIYVNFTN